MPAIFPFELRVAFDCDFFGIDKNSSLALKIPKKL